MESGSVDALVDHLFRREQGRMVAVLARIFGMSNLALAEDVVQDVLCRALEVWKFRGVPENPSAWIVAAAKNRVLDILRREKTAEAFSQMFLASSSEPAAADDRAIDALFEPSAIRDEQLRMMFTCCHPALGEEAQVALALHILCGFSPDEIAAAFLAGHAAIEKRIARAKKTLADGKRRLELNAADVGERLAPVQRALYLLFNEGYHGANPEAAIRSALCREALHLTELLLEHPLGRTPSTCGLAAMMCLHAARLPARTDAAGHFVPLEAQDRSQWDPDLIARGHEYLGRSAHGLELCDYQIEAAIASVHACSPSFADTDWAAIVSLYDGLLRLRPSAVVALNRAIAVGQHEGAARGLAEIRSIADPGRLETYPFYWAALAEFTVRCGDTATAAGLFGKAEALARNSFERAHYRQRMSACLC